MPVRPLRAPTRAAVSAALLAAVSLTCPPATAAEGPGHRMGARAAAEWPPAASGTDRTAGRTADQTADRTAGRTAARTADRTAGHTAADRTPTRPRRPPHHLADTGAAGVTRIGAVALVLLAAGVLLLAAARRLRRR
ncbi:hypothetical protein CP973_06525 [Streptomyces albofaciens JCM 4342]|uniref:hypothetical protein n=1 Tax=Streptomyces albofaciens TaxID=66866 RepID=UPI0012395F49|nr:hypothetical protein [Streptomyces albofaciens]KAA6221670.1 hypothetical protein CP973_06525 [Streptomyces albofaciens JCM 4342]